MGFFKVALGHNVLGLEVGAAWATPKYWTTHNVPCGEGGDGCNNADHYVDPSVEFIKN